MGSITVKNRIIATTNPGNDAILNAHLHPIETRMKLNANAVL